MRSPASELRRDRIAAFVIRTSGIAVILIVLAIVVSIAVQALPLFRPASTGPQVELAAVDARAIGSTGRAGSVWWLDADGELSAMHDGRLLRTDSVTAGSPVHTAATGPGGAVAIVADGSVMVGRVSILDRSEASSLPGHLRWTELATAAASELGFDAEGCGAAIDSVGDLAVAAWGSDDAVVVRWRSGRPVGRPGRLPRAGVATVAVADTLELIATTDRRGRLALYRLDGLEPQAVADDVGPVEVAAFLDGGRSLAVAGRDGSVAVLMETPRASVTNLGELPLPIGGATIEPGRSLILSRDDAVMAVARRPEVRVRRVDPRWRVVHRFEGPSAPATALAPSPLGRSFAVGDAAGGVTLFNATSGRRLVADRWSSAPVQTLAMSRRGDVVAALAGARVLRRSLDSRHPEISLRTLFLPVWYEGYAAPRAIWQTSGGADDFQPKFGLLPLLVGTIKATVYAMAISVPLALLAALYVSQLAPSWLQAVVKPAVEMMAAVPTVVVGFLAALWLAPRLELWLFPVLAAAAAVLPAIVIALLGWRLLPWAVRRRAPEGAELGVLVICLVAVCGGVFAVADQVEDRLFDGGLPQALFDGLGIQYEQRNGLVIGLALGFAVIPVIFTIAEDACSGVPSSLVLAARSLGATRWQAAVRLVAPAAGPGLAAAVMLGLGRAMGETMIVLMAAGNTPILGLGPFNGMRTMSAAIAFEMPEAAVGGTLFRVLFLTGFLLFVLSLVFTTAADLISRRLRSRYAGI